MFKWLRSRREAAKSEALYIKEFADKVVGYAHRNEIKMMRGDVFACALGVMSKMADAEEFDGRFEGIDTYFGLTHQELSQIENGFEGWIAFGDVNDKCFRIGQSIWERSQC